MTLTEKDRAEVIAELQSFKAELPALTKLNLEMSGTLIDVNALTDAGWMDQIKFENGIEYFISDTVRVEFLSKVDGVEYRVVAAIGRSVKPADNPDGLLLLSSEELRKAYSGEMPRLAYVRWVFAYVVNENKLKIENTVVLPQTVFEQVENDLRSSIRVPAKSLLEELKYQTENFAPVIEVENCSELDILLLRLTTLIKESRHKDQVSVVARMFAPLAKAMFSHEESHRKSLITSLSKPQIAMQLAIHIPYSQFHEMAAVLFESLLQNDECVFCEKDAYALDALALSLLRAGLPCCAKCIISELMALFMNSENRENKNSEISRAAYDLLWETQNRIKKVPSDVRVCSALQETLRILKPLWLSDLSCITLDSVFDIYIKEITGGDAEAALEGLKRCVELAQDEYDSAHCKDEDYEWRKDLPLSIKNPLVCQAFVYTVYGQTQSVLRAFPCPVTVSEVLPPYLPKHESIIGLPYDEIWKGLIPKSAEDMPDELISFAEALSDKHEVQKVQLYEYGGGSLDLGGRRLCFTPDAKEHELSAISVEGIENDDKTTRIHAIFPFFSTEAESFRTNIVASVWQYYPWVNNATAEAMITVDEGEVRTFYAIMPYYVEDKRCCVRGQKIKGRICGFAHSIKKDDSNEEPPKPIIVKEGPIAEEAGHPVEIGIDPDFMDCFYQDNYKEEVSRSGFSMHGRFVSKRIIKAFGRDIACIRIKCKRLPFDFEVYIASEKIDGSLNENDPINVDGWLYVDLTTPVVTTTDYVNKYPEGAPLEPMEYMGYHGVPSWVRTEWSEEAKKDFPERFREHNWTEFARNYLSSLEDVDEVVLCGKNETYVNFLVRQGDKVRKFAFFHTIDNAPIKATMQNVELLILTRTKRDKGEKLEWEIRNPKES